MRGRGREAPHTRTAPLDRAVPVISFDYCYLSDRDDSKQSTSEPESPILVMWDGRSKVLFAHFVPAKGVDFDNLDAVLKYMPQTETDQATNVLHSAVIMNLPLLHS